MSDLSAVPPTPDLPEPELPASGLPEPDLTEPSVADLPVAYVAPDELGPRQRWSTWDDVGVLAGPEPWPDWLVTSDAAVDTELGVLKTGKEADVFLVERADAGAAVVLAAKRYRDLDHRMFSRDAGYTEGRRMRNSRDRRAAAKGTRHGRAVAAGQWASAEFACLSRFWSVGLPVPYPVQLDGTELLMELITLADGSGAPRLAQTRPERPLLEAYWDQLVDAMRGMAALGLAHGDLSPYNLLAAEERLVMIDLPQAVDVVANPQGMEYLARDCRNVVRWFVARGLDVDADELLADLVAYGF